LSKEKRFNRLQIGLSTGSHFITDVYQSIYIGLIPFFTVKFELSLFQVSLMASSSILANSLFSPLFGILSDRRGIRYYLAAGPLFTSIFLSVLGVLPNFYLIIIFLFLGNLSISAYHPASAAIAGHYGGRRKGTSSSIINFGGNLGNALGSFIIILILEKIGIQYTPLIMIPGIITALVLIRFAPRDNETQRHQSTSFTLGKIENMNMAKLAMLCIILFMVYNLYIVWITVLNFMPLYYIERNISLINIGSIILVFGALGGASGLLSGYLYDHSKKGNIIIQAALFISIPLFFFAFRTGGLLSIILFIAAGFFMISVQPVCIRIAQDLLPGNMALASSLVLGLSPGIAGITMIFLGKLADSIGIVTLINYELLGLVAAFLVFMLFPVMEKRSNQHL